MSDRYYVTDTALSERFPIYTRGNVGEVFPDPVTPLTSDTALFLAELGWRDAWERMGAFDLDEFPPEEYCQLGVLGGYCYLNASLIRVFGERAPGLSWQMMDEQFFGAQPGIPPYEEMPGDVRPDMTEKIGGTFVWVFGQQSLDDLTELTEDRADTKALRATRPDLSALSDQQLWDRFREMLPWHRKMFAHHIFTSYMATVPLAVVSAVATAVGRPDLIMPILSGIGDVDSAAPSHAIWALSRLDADSTEFSKGFDEFVYEFGSRGPNEWESRSPSWETKPALALVAIDRMRQAPDLADPARQFEIRSQQRATTSAELLSMVAADPATHGQLAAAIGCSAAWLPHSLTETVRSRRAEYRHLQEVEPPFVFVGHAAGPDTWPRRDAVGVDRVSPGDTVVGFPGCPGIAEGTARVILDSNDPSALEPGDVLIAPITDPSWTPLFVPAAAVVVDVGAALSHAIIVSRELGIPCVVSAVGATRNIPDGARVRVDGNTGLVTILSVP
jgi:phosphohistidine swiveling domain-containing protein